MNRLFYLFGLAVAALTVYSLVRRICCPETCCKKEYDPYCEAFGDPGLCDHGVAD